MGDALIAMGLDDPAVAAAIDAAAENGVPVVTLVSDVPGSRRHRYVGIDNQAAGRVAGMLAGRFAANPAGRVLAVLGSHGLRDHRERLEGFRDALAQGFPGMEIADVVEGEDDNERTRTVVAQALAAAAAPPCAVYCAGAGLSGLAAALADRGLRPVAIGHDLTAETRPLLEGGHPRRPRRSGPRPRGALGRSHPDGRADGDLAQRKPGAHPHRGSLQGQPPARRVATTQLLRYASHRELRCVTQAP